MRFFDLRAKSSGPLRVPLGHKRMGPHTLDLKEGSTRPVQFTDLQDSNPPKRRIKYIIIQAEHTWQKNHFSALKFGVLAVMVAMFFNLLSAAGQARVLEVQAKREAKSAIAALHSASQKLSSGDLSEAAKFFSSSRLSLSSIADLSQGLINANYFANGQYSLISQGNNLLLAGNKLATAAEQIFYSLERVLPLRSEFLNPESKVSVTTALRAEYTVWENVYQLLFDSEALLAQTDLTLLPGEAREVITSLRTELTRGLPVMRHALDNFPALLNFLGEKYPRRYLVLLQNRNEMRSTGGFIGSVALVELNDGHLMKMEVKDVYDFDGQITDFDLPPEFFREMTNTWGLRDANYSPDFPTSAITAAKFFEKGGGYTVDGVLAINQTLIEKLLAITGEIPAEGLPIPLSSENFSTLLSLFVEMKASGEHTPKAPLIGFLPVFQQRLLENIPLKPRQLTTTFLQAIQDGQILAWSNDGSLENFFQTIGIDGRQRIIRPYEDFLQVVRTNIAGNKSDFFITQDLSHRTYFSADGAVEDELTLSRTHHWQSVWEVIWEKLWDGQDVPELFALAKNEGGKKYAEKISYRDYLPNNIYQILGRGANKDYTRIYVPLGSKIVSVEGAEEVNIYTFEDLGKQVFALRLITKPGETMTLKLRYRLPFSLNTHLDDYQLYVQNQLGVEPQPFEKSYVVAEGSSIAAQYPSTSVETISGAQNYGAVITNIRK